MIMTTMTDTTKKIIKMKRMRLINWHNFQDVIIHFNNATFLYGANGAGKTTIIDAIKYCLTTKEDFNAAGNRRSKRTLIGSIHQKQRSDENAYLRNGHTISYIAIEFEDAKLNSFVIIARMESDSPKQASNSIMKDWYIATNDCKLEDIDFTMNTPTGIAPSSKDKFNVNKTSKHMEKASNKGDAQRRICRMLQIPESIRNQFIELFNLGTNLKEIKSIQEFMLANILPEPSVQINELHEDMQHYEELQRQYNIAQQERDALKEILDIKNCVLDSIELSTLYRELDNYRNLNNKKEKQVNIQREINNCQQEKSIAESKKNEYEQEGYRLKEKQKRISGETSIEQRAFNLREEKHEKGKQKSRYAENNGIFVELLKRIRNLQDELKKNGIVCSYDVMPLLNNELKIDERRVAINEICTILSNIKDKIEDIRDKRRDEHKAIDKEYEKVTKQIDLLEKGYIQYQEIAKDIKDTINKTLRMEGKEEEAKLFCELLQIDEENKEWQDALEQFLGNNRFNIIVSPENYQIAKRVFMNITNATNTKNFGVICPNIKTNNKSSDDTLTYLSQKAYSHNPYAQQYFEYLTSNVVCCDNIDEIEKHHISVTKEGFRFQNYCLQRMHFGSHFIGNDIIKEQLKEAREEKVLLDKNRRKAEDAEIKIESLFTNYNKITFGDTFKNLLEYCDAIDKARKLEQEIEQINQDIEECERNPILAATRNDREKCEKEIRENESNRRKEENKIENLKRTIENKKKELEDVVDEYNSLKENYNNMLQMHPTLEKKIEEEEKKKLPKAEIKVNEEKANNELRKNETNLISKQINFNNAFAHDYETGLEQIEKYTERYFYFEQKELEIRKTKVNEAIARCKERFRNDVLCRLRDDILNAKSLLRPINKIMNQLDYGGETYAFTISKSKNNEYKEYYDIIMQDTNIANDDANNFSLFDGKTPEEEQMIEELMNKIMDEAKEQCESNDKTILKNRIYMDYRTYLNYDILITDVKTNEKTPLSKVESEGSGGETQVPFYIAMCASLLQIYNYSSNAKKDESIRLLLLDEAFNNMTSDRIEPMMKLFKKLGLQVVLIATTEKGSAIQPYCDANHAIIKFPKKAIIQEFVGELEEEEENEL